jgi:hypothetical protein
LILALAASNPSFIDPTFTFSLFLIVSKQRHGYPPVAPAVAQRADTARTYENAGGITSASNDRCFHPISESKLETLYFVINQHHRYQLVDVAIK